MGLDLKVWEDTGPGWKIGSYSGFHEMRQRIAAEAGLGVLETFQGYGGFRPTSEMGALEPFLAHADNEGWMLPWGGPSELGPDITFYSEETTKALEEVVSKWPAEDWHAVSIEPLLKAMRSHYVIEFR